MVAPVAAANIFAGENEGKNVTGSSGSLMLMPQDLSGRAWNDNKISSLDSKSHIEVVYRVYETGGDDVIGFTDATKHPNYEGSECEKSGYEGALFVKVGYPLPTNWEMSKAYIYSILLGTTDASGGILIEENFIDEDGNITDLTVVDPKTEEPLDPEKPIVDTNKPIGFVVKVEDWGTPNVNTLD